MEALSCKLAPALPPREFLRISPVSCPSIPEHHPRVCFPGYHQSQSLGIMDSAQTGKNREIPLQQNHHTENRYEPESYLPWTRRRTSTRGCRPRTINRIRSRFLRFDVCGKQYHL